MEVYLTESLQVHAVQRGFDRSTRGAGVLRLVLFIFLASLYLIRLGAGSLWDNSEPTYGEIVKEILRTGDYLTLHFDYKPWFIHPPLWFWTAALSVKLFGLNEFALRLPSAIFGVLACIAVYLAARRLYGELAGLCSALAFGTSLEVIVLSRLAYLDSMLLFFVTVATLWIYFAVRDGDRRAFWKAVVAAALGTLTKGPIAVVLPALVLIAFLVWTRRPFWRGLPWLGGTLVYVVLAGSWFFAQWSVNGDSFMHAYFGASNVGRYLSPFENQPGPWWYYLPVTVIGFFPFVAFLPKGVKTAWQRWTEDERYLLVAAIVPFIFFSFAQTKLPNYIVVIFPSLAIMVGRVLGDAISNDDLVALRGALIFLPASLVLVTAGVILYGQSQHAGPFAELAPSLAVLGWLVVPTALLTLALTYLTRRVWIAPVGLGLMMAGFITAVVFAILPRVETFKPMKGMAAVVRSYYHPGDKIGIMGPPGGFSLRFYTESRGVTSVGYSKDADQTPEAFFRQPVRVLCVVSPSDIDVLRHEGIKIWVLDRAPRVVLVTNRPPQAH